MEENHPTGQEASNARRGRAASGGAAARRAARSGGGPGQSLTYIRRKIKVYEVLDEEGLALIEHNADTVLEEIGIIFRDDAEALRRAVESALARFEPRLRQVSVRIRDRESENDRTLRMVIEGLLWVEPDPQPITFDTLVQPLSGQCTVQPR